MYCVHNGKVCVMLWNPIKNEWVYIPESEVNHEKNAYLRPDRV